MTSTVRQIAATVTSLRFRMVLTTATAVTAMVALGGFLSVRAVRAEFMDAASWVARDHASEVAHLARTGALPSDLTNLDEGETLIQVVRRGRVVSHTENVSGSAPLPMPSQPPDSSQQLSVERLPEGTGPYQVVALGTTTPRGPATVLVAVSTEDVADVTAAALKAGMLGLILLVVPLSVLLWFALGRTLAPVDAIRERADAITAEHLSARVPEPPRLDEIGRLARTINAMLTRLDVSAREQRRFLADAAHELRSPIASLRAQLEANGRARIGDDEAYVEDLRADVLRMQALVDQLLLLARSDAGALRRRNVTVDLDDTVAGVLEALRLENPRQRIAVDIRGVSPVQVSGDPVLLEQLVRNLLENAVKYASREVRVSLGREDVTAVLTVDDDGPGIPAESRAEVFRRFTRLDDSRDRGAGGVGLGLAIVVDIVRAHAGTVTVSDAPIGGARFRVQLPAGAPPQSVPVTGPGPTGTSDRRLPNRR